MRLVPGVTGPAPLLPSPRDSPLLQVAPGFLRSPLEEIDMRRWRNFSNSANFSANESDANRVRMTRLPKLSASIRSSVEEANGLL